MSVNESEKRRRKLLEQTRELYSEKKTVPAVHPRYGFAYRQTSEEEQLPPAGTFGIRLFLCLLLFAAFVSMDKQGSEVGQVDSKRIVDEITNDVDIAEVWREL
jgi:hypothetical protein